MNNPPDGGGEKSKSSKADRRAAKATKASSGTAGDHDARDAEVDAMAGGGDDPEGAEEEEDDWAVDTSEAAVRARTAELGGGVTHLTYTDDLEKSMSERLEIFNAFVVEGLKKPKLPQREVIKEAERLDCKEKGGMVLAHNLLLEGDVIAQLAKYQGLFQRFTIESDKAQKYLLGAMEKLIEQRPEVLPKTAHLFKQLYDLDIIDEEAFVKWAKKPSKKNVGSELAMQIHANAKPFIEWLTTAEEESSEDDGGAEFVEETTTEPADEDTAGAAGEDDDAESDVDIDDM